VNRKRGFKNNRNFENTIGEQFPEEKTTIEKSYIFQGENYIFYRFHGRNE
jgi:hypothetical protein